MLFDTALPKLCQENIPCKTGRGLIKLKTKKIIGHALDKYFPSGAGK
jgi:hypothetical protein